MQKEYIEWLESATINPEIKRELLLMDEKEIQDAFSKKIEFGTAGLRGLMGAGTNRINYYVIAKATQGFLEYLKDLNPNIYERGIAITYDNRRLSQQFAALCANICASMQIKSYIFEELRPTPQLSFMIRHLNCVGGINITASHNTKEYNGFKIYDSSGCQFLPNQIEKIVEYINAIKNELTIEIENFSNNDELIYFLDHTYDDIFISHALDVLKNKHLLIKDTGIVFTPLHGCGAKIIPKIMEQAGFSHFFVEKQQMVIDPDFSTCPNPNPEDFNAYALAIAKAKELNIDYVLASDPDADRIGICVRKEEEDFKLLSGNEIAGLLVHYLLEQRQRQGLLVEESLLIDTIVSSDFARKIAESYDVNVISVLTGFKYIGDLINRFEKTKEYQFEFGYEESLGFLASDYVRDKDAISTALLIVEMINYYQSLGLSLLDVLNNLYEKHGYYLNKQISIILDSILAQTRIDKVMEYFRSENLVEINGIEIVEIADYERQKLYQDDKMTSLNTPIEKTIKIVLADESWLAIRPSGTEPKLKFYLAANSSNLEEVKYKIKQLQDYINTTLDNLFA